jgi:hypothetical protein
VVTTLQVYMAAYSCELSILAALLLGAGIGAYIAYGYGWDKGSRNAWDRGYEFGYHTGKSRLRNAKGQFSK